jgi:aspartyl-tRNA(Asn)/glutamyl-tRNA(Gln) amidotransferase subunit B
MNDVLRLIKERGGAAGELKLRPDQLAEIIILVDEKKVTTSTGKDLLEKVEATGKSPKELVEEESLGQVSDEGAIRDLVAQVIAENPDQVETYKSGKTSLAGWFVGQVMQKTSGQANPQLVKKMIDETLNNA